MEHRRIIDVTSGDEITSADTRPAQKVYAGGYVIETWENHECVVATKFPDPDFRIIYPLEIPGLYREFIAINDNDSEAVLAFVAKYGLLTENIIPGISAPSYQPDEVETRYRRAGGEGCRVEGKELIGVIQLYKSMLRKASEMLDAVRNGSENIYRALESELEGRLLSRRQYLSKREAKVDELVNWRPGDYPPQTEVELVKEAHKVIANILEPGLREYIVGSTDMRNPLLPKILFQPRNLLGILYLQLQRDFVGEESVRRCEACGDWFVYGSSPKANKSTRRYCSQACQMKAYRRRKSNIEGEQRKTSASYFISGKGNGTVSVSRPSDDHGSSDEWLVNMEK